MKNLDMDLLRTLVTIQRTNTFSGAADALFKTQSAVTQQMQRLETLMGFALFKKEGRGRNRPDHLHPLTTQVYNMLREKLG